MEEQGILYVPSSEQTVPLSSRKANYCRIMPDRGAVDSAGTCNDGRALNAGIEVTAPEDSYLLRILSRSDGFWRSNDLHKDFGGTDQQIMQIMQG